MWGHPEGAAWTRCISNRTLLNALDVLVIIRGEPDRYWAELIALKHDQPALKKKWRQLCMDLARGAEWRESCPEIDRPASGPGPSPVATIPVVLWSAGNAESASLKPSHCYNKVEQGYQFSGKTFEGVFCIDHYPKELLFRPLDVSPGTSGGSGAR